MKHSFPRMTAVAFFLFIVVPSFSQYTFFTPPGSFAIEISLSKSNLKRMPMYRNAVASLTVRGDQIIGSTAAEPGLSPYLFVASLGRRELITLKDLNDVLKGQRSIQSGFFKGKNNILYAGTIANASKDGVNGDGHLLQVVVDTGSVVHVTDLGVPAKGEGIFTLTGDSNTNMLYGITYPSGTFFSYSVAGKAFKTYRNTVPSKEDLHVLTNEFHQKPEDFLCGSLIVDDKGMVYGSQPVNKIFFFNPSDESFNAVSDLPEVWGRRTLGRVEAFAKSKDGLLYGGNAGDGQLFVVNPATNTVKNLGKPIMMHRLRGLCFGADEKLYGIAGALPGYAHLFSFDQHGEGYTDLGNPQFILKAPGIEQGIEWRGFQLRTIAASEDGKYIVMGEDEALSQLMIFPVGSR